MVSDIDPTPGTAPGVDESDHLARIPQVLTAALSASVFICIAQRLGAYFGADLHLTAARGPDWPELLLGAIPLILTMAWTAKNSVDEFKAFGDPPSNAFSLGATVLFSTCAYVALATAGSLVFDGMKASWALSIFFGICTLWSLESVRRHSRLEAGKRDKKKYRQRLEWAIAYPFCAAALAVYACRDGAGWAAWLPLVPIVYFFRDAWKCETFFTNRKGSA